MLIFNLLNISKNMNKSRRFFLLFVVCAISFSGSAFARVTPISRIENSSELMATITSVSGREITGEFRFNKLDYGYKFRSSPKDKFLPLDLDTIVRLVLSNEIGVLAHFECMPLYYMISKTEFQLSTRRVLLLIRWASDGGIIAIREHYEYDAVKKQFKITTDPNFSKVAFRAPNATEYVDIINYKPFKSSYDFLTVNERVTSWNMAAYNEYFKKYCPEFLEKRPFATSKVFEPMKFLKEYEDFCVND
jgi:hypothetical protein